MGSGILDFSTRSSDNVGKLKSSLPIAAFSGFYKNRMRKYATRKN